jgi:predicted transcriptional regulator
MEELWRPGEAPVRAVMDAVNRRTGKKPAYTTYIDDHGARLYRQGMLVRHRQGKTDFYVPSQTREEYAALRARTQVEDLVAQYVEVALSNFAGQMASLDPARRRALLGLARQAETDQR